MAMVTDFMKELAKLNVGADYGLQENDEDVDVVWQDDAAWQTEADEEKRKKTEKQIKGVEKEDPASKKRKREKKEKENQKQRIEELEEKLRKDNKEKKTDGEKPATRREKSKQENVKKDEKQKMNKSGKVLVENVDDEAVDYGDEAEDEEDFQQYLSGKHLQSEHLLQRIQALVEPPKKVDVEVAALLEDQKKHNEKVQRLLEKAKEVNATFDISDKRKNIELESLKKEIEHVVTAMAALAEEARKESLLRDLDEEKFSAEENQEMIREMQEDGTLNADRTYDIIWGSPDNARELDEEEKKELLEQSKFFQSEKVEVNEPSEEKAEL